MVAESAVVVQEVIKASAFPGKIPVRGGSCPAGAFDPAGQPSETAFRLIFQVQGKEAT